MSSLNHEQKPKLDDIVLENDILYNTASGLGADDKAGVYALLELKDLPYNLLFTNYEETGRDGVKWAIQDIKDVLYKNTCFVEIDRKGTGHYVDYIGAKKEFLNIFEERGLHKEWAQIVI